MVELLEKAIAEVTKLSKEQQEAFAQWMLDELEDEKRWDKSFADSLPQLDKLGKKALSEYRAGKTTDLDPDILE